MTAYAIKERGSEGRVASGGGGAPEASAPPDAGSCIHYWVIEPANGPISRGVCQSCRAEREFKNFVDGYDPPE